MSDPGILFGKRLLVTGVVNRESIAFAVAQTALRHGAEIVLTSFDRDWDRTVEAARDLGDVEVIELDVTQPEHFVRLGDRLSDSWGRLDGALHAVAFAPRSALAGDFVAAERDAVERAFATSTFSYAALAQMVDRLAPTEGASIVGLDFESGGGAWPVYNWMGVCKTALQSVSRYVARDLGPRRIRSNLVAAGPLHTRAAGGIPDFDKLLSAWEHGSPLEWDPTDAQPVADAVCFLLSDLARAVTGEILHVDGGYHAMAAPLR